MDKVILGYICGTDPTDLHLGALDVKIYPTIEDLKKHRTCWEECGIIEVVKGEVIVESKIGY